MGHSQDLFAGFLDGWLLGVSPADFVIPTALLIWLVMLLKLPLLAIDRDHQISGYVYATVFCFFGTWMLLVAPEKKSSPFSLSIDFILVSALFCTSFWRWNKAKNLSLSEVKEKNVKEKNIK